MPWGASSWRSALVSDHSADLAAQYPPIRGKLIQDSADRMFRTAPPPFAAIFGAKARVTASVPK
jgi:hypothetical protein